jgi:hypothetical protein
VTPWLGRRTSMPSNCPAILFVHSELRLLLRSLDINAIAWDGIGTVTFAVESCCLGCGVERSAEGLTPSEGRYP